MGRWVDTSPIAGGTVRGDTFGTVGGGWTNKYTGQGASYQRTSATRYQPPFPLTKYEIDALYRYESIASRVVSREPQDATREGFRVLVDGRPAPELDRKAQAFAEASGLMDKIAETAILERAHGGAGLVVFVDDGLPLSEPMDLRRVSRVLSLLPLDRWQLSPESWEDRIDSPRLGLPRRYYAAALGSSATVHASRVARFGGIDLGIEQTIQNGGWGGSVLDRFHRALMQYATVSVYAAEAVTLMTQGIWSVKGLIKAYASGRIDRVLDRIEAIRHGMGSLGDIVIDADSETYDVKSRAFAGLKDAFEGAKDYLVAHADEMPRSLLFSEKAAGLNAGENAGDTRAWYDHVHFRRVRRYAPRILEVLSVAWGGRPPGVSLEWDPLWQLSEAEQADVDLKSAQRRAADIVSGVVSPDEARREPRVVEIYGIDPNAPAPDVDAGPEGVEDPGVGGDGDGDGDGAELEDRALSTQPIATIPEGEDLISARDAARRLGVGAQAIRSMAARGEIHAWRVGRRCRFSWSQISAAVSG